jgi:hypothetical protein
MNLSNVGYSVWNSDLDFSCISGIEDAVEQQP